MPVETEIKFRVDDLRRPHPAPPGRRLHACKPRAASRATSSTTRPTARCAPAPKSCASAATPAAGPSPTSACPTPAPAKTRHKHRIETETEVADGDALAQVFLSLGLVPAFRYEKWRAEWTDGEGHCVVDETPIGNYAELEGPAEWIDRAAARLGVDPAQYITLSYGRLFELWREQHGSAAQDLTFAAVAQALDARP